MKSRLSKLSSALLICHYCHRLELAIKYRYLHSPRECRLWKQRNSYTLYKFFRISNLHAYFIYGAPSFFLLHSSHPKQNLLSRPLAALNQIQERTTFWRHLVLNSSFALLYTILALWMYSFTQVKTVISQLHNSNHWFIELKEKFLVLFPIICCLWLLLFMGHYLN